VFDLIGKFEKAWIATGWSWMSGSRLSWPRSNGHQWGFVDPCALRNAYGHMLLFGFLVDLMILMELAALIALIGLLC
jgi:hypothetical protein